jgi:hypothetical protein
VLLVAVKVCELPSLADHNRRCELFGIPENARLRFRKFMEAPVKSEPVAFPGKAFAVSNIPDPRVIRPNTRPRQATRAVLGQTGEAAVRPTGPPRLREAASV